jgi:hypothetical protein
MDMVVIFGLKWRQISAALRRSDLEPVIRARNHQHAPHNPPTHEPPAEETQRSAVPGE